MFFKSKISTDSSEPESSDNIEDHANIIKPKLLRLFNWLIFCSFILILASYLSAQIYIFSFIFCILVTLIIKLYLLNKLPPTNFKIYIIIFLIVFVLCEYNHLQIVHTKTIKISSIDYRHLLTDPGIFVGALCNIIFTTKIHVANQLFFSENFIQWFAIYFDKTPEQTLVFLDGVFMYSFGYVIPIFINFIYAMLIGVTVIRIKQLIFKN
ncbi:hypothetical protein [Francisella sp. SYW-2]|uniref:hypothetical protein n=1 Tax=Francisella sp. SYW-2 TaxID=2610886 RepID=UPI00123D83DC|nr:hypothetical protein [Francisella sp. SYW-2]